MKTESGGDISWVTDKLRETQDSEFLIFKGQTFTYDDLLTRISFFRKNLNKTEYVKENVWRLSGIIPRTPFFC